MPEEGGGEHSNQGASAIRIPSRELRAVLCLHRAAIDPRTTLGRRARQAIAISRRQPDTTAQKWNIWLLKDC
jgi:hypothetical protein